MDEKYMQCFKNENVCKNQRNVTHYPKKKSRKKEMPIQKIHDISRDSIFYVKKIYAICNGKMSLP